MSLVFLIQTASAQITIYGTLTDITKFNAVEGAEVFCTNGNTAVTDSFGRYKIAAGYRDSIYFFYQNKPTQKFAVAAIPRPDLFEVSLKIPIKTRYTVLQEVVILANSYRQDSMENRIENEKYFSYSKPGLSTSVSPTGGVGADVNELINIFRFKRKKRFGFLQNYLEEREEERYINYRFSKKVIQRITNLTGPSLDSFLVWYRPSYDFTAGASELEFNQYILNSLYHYRKIMPLGGSLKNEE
jgi:hypothetical protein